MTGTRRTGWWLAAGCSAMAVGVVLMATLGGALGCSAGGFAADSASAAEAAASACTDSLDGAQRSWTIGAALLLLGLATVAFDVGFRRGRRAGRTDAAAEVAS